jgi:hypothetical protein
MEEVPNPDNISVCFLCSLQKQCKRLEMGSQSHEYGSICDAFGREKLTEGCFKKVETKKSIVDLNFISYDGKYPNLCSGRLCFEALFNDNTRKEYYLKNCLTPNDDDYYNSKTVPWTFCLNDDEEEYPLEKHPEFTPMVVAYLEKIINENVEWGHCGGCR